MKEGTDADEPMILDSFYGSCGSFIHSFTTNGILLAAEKQHKYFGSTSRLRNSQIGAVQTLVDKELLEDCCEVCFRNNSNNDA